jgi:ubiquinone/menaquinone biosynthesis C-methylase UbiE
MSDPRVQNIEAWRSVAAGWERQRTLFWAATRPVSERLVELLDPQPGETIVDIAAGPGDTGFLALPRVRPGGRLVSTDVAPEMVEAARRRAAELGLDQSEVTFALEDAVALSFDDASVDGVLCRWGLMLVPDMDAAAAEMARILRPGAGAAVAVWADPDENDWITAAGRSAVELGLMERPDPEAPGPFRLSGEGRLESLLTGARLAVDVIEDVPIIWRASALEDWWGIVCDTSRMLSQLLDQISADEARGLRAGAERRLERYVEDDGSLAVPGLARVALARRD